MNKYQMLFIIENDIEDDAKEAVITKYTDLIESLGGSVSMVDKWGTRKYAYPINYKDQGYYVLVQFESAPSAIAEIERQMKINENVVRQMITKQF